MASDPSTFSAYIDESGCSGDKFGNGSSTFLAMGAVIVRDDFHGEVLSAFDEARAERGQTKAFQKFSKESDKGRYVLSAKVASKRIRTCFVAIHKPSMKGSYIRDNHANEYNYLLKMLIERVSWAVRDAQTIGERPNGPCSLVLSEQRMWSYPDMFEYLGKLRRGAHNCRAHRDALSPTEPEVVPHQDETAIHIADIAASAFAMAIEPKQHGMTDDRFLRLLAPTIYSKHGKRFGLKIFPDKEMAATTASLLKVLG